MRALLPILAAICIFMPALGGIGGCDGGTSSETVGVATGMVEATPGADGIACRTEAGTVLGLYSEDFQPHSDIGFAKTAIADPEGKFAFGGLEPGRYQLLARAADGKAALLTGLVVPSASGAPERAALEPAGSLAGIITDSASAFMGLVYAPGTPFFARGDSLMRYSLAGMPAGNYRIVKTWKRLSPCAPDVTCGGVESLQDTAEVRIRSGENAAW
jgi:hypothetical protein